MLRRFVSASALGALAALACGQSNTGTTSSADTGGDAGPTISCEHDARVDTYVANLVKKSTSGQLVVTLMASDPAPPIRGTNVWTLKVTGGDGTITVTPFMPDHGHGTSVKPTATPKPDGTFDVQNLYFFMPGVWRTTIASGAESVDFFFCVAG